VCNVGDNPISYNWVVVFDYLRVSCGVFSMTLEIQHCARECSCNTRHKFPCEAKECVCDTRMHSDQPVTQIVKVCSFCGTFYPLEDKCPKCALNKGAS
jgi:hypothetical protein